MPLFALANAGVAISGPFLAQAFTSPVTLGILAGYVLGKPLGITGTSFLVTRLSKGRLRPPAGWASIIGAGTIAGIGFTVSLLIASLAFTGPELADSPHWPARRPPFLLETSHPGVFAAGDVRAGSAKRVASAVGEGAMAVMLVHEYLKGL